MKKLTLLLLATLCLSLDTQAQKIKLIIDAAHGGQDAGATAVLTADKESDLCLQFAQALQEEAQKKEIEVVMVRTEDEYIALQDRNNNQPEDGVKSYYISFHMNADNTGKERGARIMYYGKTKDAAAIRKLAEKLKDGFNLINDIGTTVSDKGNAAILRTSAIPALVIEPGYITNQQDLKKLKDKGIQMEVAMLIVKAITE
jgi:N-acetylmuramoyl-L-alanine amidase